MSYVDIEEVSNEIAENFQEAFRKSISFLKRFYGNKNRVKGGGDASMVYMFLLYTAYEQKTHIVWAKYSFIQQGLDIGDDRLKKAMDFLKTANMIEEVTRYGSKGIEGKYWKLKSLYAPVKNEKISNEKRLTAEIVDQPKDRPTKSRTNAYKEIINKDNKLSLFKNAYKEKVKARFKNRVSEQTLEQQDKDFLTAPPIPQPPLLPSVEDMKKRMNDKKISKLRDKPVLTRADMYSFYRSMRSEYGYTTMGLNPTEEDLRYAGFITKKIDKPRDYVESVIKSWKQLRKKIVYENSKNSKLPELPDLKNLWLSREAILFAMTSVVCEEVKEKTRYTNINQLPKDIPNRKTFENVIKTVGYVEI